MVLSIAASRIPGKSDNARRELQNLGVEKTRDGDLRRRLYNSDILKAPHLPGYRGVSFKQYKVIL